MALSNGTNGPVIELRQYRLHPGTREHLIALFAWLCGFDSVQAHDMHLESPAGNDAWRMQVLPAMDRLMWRREQVLRLAPTARSLLGVPA